MAAKEAGGFLAGAGGTAAVADAAEGSGLDRIGAAAQSGLDTASRFAGDVLRGIFGGLPWEMSPSEIVSAVANSASNAVDAIGQALAGGATEAASATVVPYLIDLVGVV